MSRAWLLLRSMLASGAATLADQGALLVAVVLLGVPARIASVPALVLAGLVNFVANRHFAFRAGEGRLAAQALRFAGVQAVSIALNALFFDLGMRALASHPGAYWLLRLAVNNVVYLAWSFPMFRRVFSHGGMYAREGGEEGGPRCVSSAWRGVRSRSEPSSRLLARAATAAARRPAAPTR